MLTVGKLMIAIVIWAAVPLLFGSLWNCFGTREKGGVMRAYLMGSVTEWALFFLMAKWAIIGKKSLRELCIIWLAALAVLVLTALVLLVRRIRKRGISRDISSGKPRPVGMLFLPVLIAVAILCGGTNQGEYTIEEAWTMYATDTLYEYDAVTGHGADEMLSFERQQMEARAEAPVEAYYAANAFVCNWNPAKFIRLVLPVFLIPFYFGVYQAWGVWLFGEARGKRIAFQVTVWLLYGLALVSERSYVFGIFTNCWNGETLLFAGLVPFAVLLVLEEKERKRRTAQYLVCAAAGQLLSRDGFFVMTFLWGTALLVERIKGWKIEN